MSNRPDAQPTLRPAMPPMAPDHVSGLGVLSRLRRNGLGGFPARCLAEPVVRLSLPGRALLIVSDGEAAAEVLQARAEDFVRAPTGRRVLGPVVGQGLLTSEGETWRRQRKVMAPAFTPRTLPMMAAHVARTAEPAVARLESMGERPLDLLAEMQALSLEIASVSMFSLESAGFRAEVRRRLNAYMAGPGRPRAEDFVAPQWLPTPLALRRRAFRKGWVQLISGVIAERRATQATPRTQARDLFDLLDDAHGAGGGELLLDEVATMLVAGHETTGLTLFWALYLLAQSPGWRAALAAEAAALDLSPAAAAAALDRLPLTRAVVNETLRLYSPAFLTARVAARTSAVAGCAFPKGALVLIPFWMIHRRPDAWADPDVFDPRRFLGSGGYDRQHFLPFGLGPHVCIGAQLAISEAVLVLAMILRRRAPRLAPGEPPVIPSASLSTRPSHAPSFHLDAVTAAL